MPGRSRRTRVATSAGILTGLGVVLASLVHADSVSVNDPALARALSSFSRRPAAQHTIRRLRAGTLNGKHVGWLEAEAELGEGTFSYRVMSEGGSKRTCDKVLRAVLDGERDAVENWSLSALTTDNYIFMPETSRAGELRRIGLTPRRRDERLVEGVLTITPDGRPVSVEGRLVKSPSFWVRSVTVIRRFATINGITLPVSVESLADVRVVGPSAFSMQYEYKALDHVPVTFAAAADTSLPSSRLLALHTAFKSLND